MSVFSNPFLMQNANLGGGAVGGWKELARTTLGSAGTVITVSSLPNKRYYMLLMDNRKSAANSPVLTMNNDSGNNYAIRYSNNGGADGTSLNTTGFSLQDNGGAPEFDFVYVANYSTKEKLAQAFDCYQNAAGAGTAPDRTERVAKWTNTTDAISRFDVTAGGSANNFSIGAECVVLGYDPADTHTTNFWEELASVTLGSAGDQISSGTFTAKKYLWIQVWSKNTGGTTNQTLHCNSDTGTNYAIRYSQNGGADATDVTAGSANLSIYADSFPKFSNIFIINNSANEKLIISNTIIQNTAGAGTAPNRTDGVYKWTNTSSQITRIDIDNTGTGSYDIGSTMRIWGSN